MSEVEWRAFTAHLAHELELGPRDVERFDAARFGAALSDYHR